MICTLFLRCGPCPFFGAWRRQLPIWIFVFRCIQFSGLIWIFVFRCSLVPDFARFPLRLEFSFFGAVCDNSNSNYYFRFLFLFLFRFRFRLRPSACSDFRFHPFPWAARRCFPGGGVADYTRARSLNLARSRRSGGVGLLQVDCKSIAR